MSTSPLSSFSESISEALEAVTLSTTPLAIQESRAWLQGTLLAMCMYGIHLTLFMICSSTLIRQLKQSRKIFIENGCYRLKEFLADSGTKLRILLITYTVSMLVCGTVMVASQCYVTQAAFVDHNIRVGQPAKWEEMKYTGTIGTAGHTTWVLSAWLGELVTVWRFIVIYRFSRCPRFIVITIPLLLFTASFVFGILFIVQVASYNRTPFASSPFSSHNFTIPFICIVAANNLVIPFSIAIRILLCRYRLVRASGVSPKKLKQYTSIAAILMESSTLQSTIIILFVVTYALDQPSSRIWVQMMNQAQLICPLLIIFRVIQGKGWSKSAPDAGATQSNNFTSFSEGTMSFVLDTQVNSRPESHFTINSLHLRQRGDSASATVTNDVAVGLDIESGAEVDVKESEGSDYKPQ